MKKLMVIAAASFFMLTGCAKVDTTPDLKTSTLSAADQKQAPFGNINYTITNTETDWGIVEYRLEYTDCNNKLRNVPLLMQESITVCLKYGFVKTNFAYTIVPAN
jgi:uncharacterized lipoprotein YajG